MAKGTEGFKQTIQEHLNFLGFQDPLFAKSLKKEGKNIDDCCTYIMNTVQKSGKSGFSDNEIFKMAVHYYDEDVIEIGKNNNGKVVVNYTIDLTEDEIAEAKKKAIANVTSQEKINLEKKVKEDLAIELKGNLTEKEIATARNKAKKMVFEEQRKAMVKKPVKKETDSKLEQKGLF